MKILDLFSGIGGFSKGFEKAGFETAAFCEIDPFCQKVLNQHWPSVPIFSDIVGLTGRQLEGLDIDIITGGFPCQDLSTAGRQKGINGGTKSGLWWEMWRLINEIRPKFAIMENVPNLLSGGGGAWFGEFLGSLAEIGYDAQWSCISAAAVGKTHLRKRVWIIAYPNSLMRQFFKNGVFSKSVFENYHKKQGKSHIRGLERAENSIELLPKHLRVDDGLPAELDEIKSRVKACGNSIVPEITYLIAEQIAEEY